MLAIFVWEDAVHAAKMAQGTTGTDYPITILTHAYALAGFLKSKVLK